MGVEVWLRFVKKAWVWGRKNSDIDALEGFLHLRGGFVLERVSCPLSAVSCRMRRGVARMGRRSKIVDGGSKIEGGMTEG